MSKPKRHHYVPQFYLNYFADEQSMIWVYDRKTKEYRHQTVKDTAVQNNYYRVRLKGGEQSSELESFFSQLEGLASVAINKLERGASLTEEEKGNIALFVSFQMTRVPYFEKRINEGDEKLMKRMTEMKFHSVEASQAWLKKLKENGKDGGHKVTAEEMYEFVQKGEYNIKFPREASIRTMLKLAYNIAGKFIQMDWLILRVSKDGAFITSDNPYTLFPHPEYNPNSFWDGAVGILTPGAKKALPLSPNTSLFMCDHGGRFAETIAPRNNVRKINIFYAQTSDRFIFAKDELLLRSIVKRSRIDEIPNGQKRVNVS